MAATETIGPYGRAVEDPRAELRLGLVLYGGVSLAIYIYGVVYEFWRLVRASRGFEQNEYRELLQAAKREATVDVISGTSAGGINGVLLAKALDVISGTSAGGINGVLLAKALATGGDLGAVRNLWVDSGDFLKLVRSPGDKEPRSLLRSELFFDLARDGFASLDPQDPSPVVPGLDLFVPATRLRGWVRRFLDTSGGVVETREHRKVFHLKLRTQGFNPVAEDDGYDRNDFVPEANDRLTEVARATSAFPFAFEPQLIRRGKGDPRFSDAEPDAEFFADGGILDNKPFTETIATIYARAAFRPVERWLMSVEPDPQPARVDDPNRVPEFIEVVSGAVMRIPRSESIAGDLERLREHRAIVQRANALAERIDRVLDEYTVSDVAELETVIGPVGAEVYRGVRRATVRDELARRLQSCAGLGNLERPAIDYGIAQALEDIPDVLIVDLAFERRRVYHLLGLIDSAESPEYRALLRLARQHLWASFETIERTLRDTFGRDAPPAVALRRLGPNASQTEIASTVRDVVPGVVDALARGVEDVAQYVAAVTTQVDERMPPDAVRERVPTWRPLRWVFDHYAIWDVFLLVVDHVSGVRERDEIRHRHITPRAARYIQVAQDRKLAGDSLGHFGGFMKRSWRENDILWGRLDAAETIVRTLLRDATVDGEDGRPRQLLPDERAAWIRRVQEPIALAELPELRKRANPDYKQYLEQEYDVGAESVADVDVQDRAELFLTGSEVVRNMLRALKETESRGLLDRGIRRVFGWAGLLLGALLTLLRWPLRAAFARDRALRRGVSLMLFILFFWAAATLLLMLLGFLEFALLKGALGRFVAIAVALYAIYLLFAGIGRWVMWRRERKRRRALQARRG